MPSSRCDIFCSGVGTTGALGAGAPVKIVVSRACPYSMCSFITPTSIALSCSSRTDVLSCSAGTDGAEMDRFFFCQQTSVVVSALSCFVVSIILKIPMFVYD